MSTLGDAADVNPAIKFLPHTCNECGRNLITDRADRTETWSVSPSVDMLPFGVSIPATLPQRWTCPHSSRQNQVTYRVESSFSTPYGKMSLSCFTSHRVATVTVSKSSLNLWSTRLRFSAGNGWRSLGDDFLYIMRVRTNPLITKLSSK